MSDQPAWPRVQVRAAEPATTVVLVEGESDRAALVTLAARLGRDFDAEGVHVVVLGGATNIGPVLRRLRATRRGVRVAGLCDAGEAPCFRRALATTGAMEAHGFFVCDADLEDELIRAMGVEEVEALLDAHGELELFRTFQRQPAQRGRRREEQLRRFLGTKSGRKIRYGTLLAGAVDLAGIPQPLARLLAHLG